jgi:hypothetical protein
LYQREVAIRNAATAEVPAKPAASKLAQVAHVEGCSFIGRPLSRKKSRDQG